MKLFRQLLVPGLLLFVLLPFIIPLFTQGFGYSDGGWMVVRLSAFHETLREGQFPVRFLERLNHGYGYPVVNFLYPLPFYLGEVVHLLGFNFLTSVTLLFALSLVGGAVGMYLYIRRSWGERTGIFAAILYTIFPYHLYDIFVRGSLGEVVAFLFLPFVFLFSDQVAKQTKRRYQWAILLAISLACLITSHNTLSLIFAPLIGLYWVILILTHHHIKAFILSAVTALLLSAFFWMPALFELSATRAPSVKVANYFEYFVTGANFNDLLGIPTIIILFILTIISLRRSHLFSLSEKTLQLILFLLTSLGAIALSTRFFDLLWQGQILVQLVQFPWRFIAIPTFGLSIIGAVLLARQKVIGIILMVLIVTLQIVRLNIQAAPRDENLYVTSGDTTTVKNEYMPKWVKTDPLFLPKSNLEIISGEGKVESENQVSLTHSGVVQMNKVYFPGTKIFVNGKESAFSYEEEGFVRISLEAGTYTISRKFTEMPLRQVANSLTILGGVLILVILLWPYVKNRLRLIAKK